MGKKAKRRAVLRIEVPFTSDPPVLTSDALGLPRLLRRPAASFVMDVTVIDAADGRLLRDGVVVAHRVVGGIGEWYLSAPRWSPHLPEECTRPLGTNSVESSKPMNDSTCWASRRSRAITSASEP